MLSLGLVTYNHEKYIEDALKGLLAQKGKDVELIILDDASVDNTQGVIQQYIDRLSLTFERVVNICHDINVGSVSKNANEIIELARGDFFWLLSGDDILREDVLSKMTSVLQNEPDCSVVYTNMIVIDDNYHYGDLYDENFRFLEKQVPGIQNNMYYRLMYACCVPTPAAMKRMELYQKYGKHDENYFAEDYEYWLRISRTEKFYYLEEPALLYRRAETSLTNYNSLKGHKKLQKMMEVDFNIKKTYISYLEDSEQAEVWKGFYTGYLSMCNEIGYDEGKEWIHKKMTEENLLVDERYKDSGSIINRLNKENDLLVKWVDLKDKVDFLEERLKKQGIRSIGIYGYSRLGELLISELAKTEIEVKYVIDKKGKMLQLNIPVYTLQEELDYVDAIIIAPMNLLNDIKKDIVSKVDTVIFEITELFV